MRAALIRRRQALVDQREEAIARVSGHVADSLMNMDTVRSFAAEHREAAEHRSRVAESRRLSLRSWDYGNLRIDTVVAPMSVLTNALGLLLALSLGAGEHGVEAVVVAFTYYSNATRIMFECSVEIPGRTRCSSTNRRGPAARSRMISSVHLSPTRSSARASGDHWS